MERALRVWVGLVGVTAFAHGVRSLLNEDYLREMIFTLRPELATPLFSRTTGALTLTAAAVRLTFAFSPYSRSLYMLTLFTFLSALVQFSSEVFLFHTAPLGYGTISPLLVASVSSLWLIAMFPRMQRHKQD